MPMVAVKQPFILFILDDDTPPNPRQEQENLGKMVCFNNKYNLGDEHNFRDPDEFLVGLLEERLEDYEAANEKFEVLMNQVDISKYENHYGEYRKAVHDNILNFLSNSYVIEPIYLYDHSGITINTTGFSCPWDSGKIGWIYISYDDIQKEYGSVSEEIIEKARKILIEEVKEYDYYLTGQCYGFKLYKDNEEIASSWGFVGEIRDVQNRIKEYMPTDYKDIVEVLKYQYENSKLEDILEKTKNHQEEMEV